MRPSLLALGIPAVLAAQAPARAPAPVFRRNLAQVRAEISGERALATTAFVERLWRLPGNAGFNATLARVAAILDSAGFVPESLAPRGARLTYRIEHRRMTRPAWEPVSGTLTIVGQPEPVLRFATNRNMIAINSASTPPGGVEGELVWVGNGTAEEMAKVPVAGRIVAGDAPVSRLYAEAVRKRGALGVLGYAMPAYTRPEVNRESIQFTAIPWDSTRPGWGLALSYGARERLQSALAAGPARVRVEIETRLFPSEERTLVAEVRGRARPAERFVFSAHAQEPGANDNASGVAALAEVARATAALIRSGRQDPGRTITFLWGDEITSTARFLREDSARAAGVRWGMSLDMVGEDTRRTGGTFLIEKMPDPSAIWTRGEDRHTEWGGEPLTAERLTPHYFNDYVLDRCLDEAEGNDWVVKTNPYEGGSDHVPFLDAGKPGLLLWHFTDQFYHTDGDRIDKVSAEELRHVATCALSAALGLVSADAATARAVVAELERAAVARIEREAALSVAAVTHGSSRDHELGILRAWAEWYRAALPKALELEIGGPSPATRRLVARAQAAVDRAFERARRQVFEE